MNTFDTFRLGTEPADRPNTVRSVMTEEEHWEAEEMEHLGLASPLVSCEQCGGWPRGIAKSFTQPAHFPDPSVVLTLTCGHRVL